MSIYPLITKDVSVAAIQKILAFKDSIAESMEEFGLSLESNICRRNAILSEAQERFFCDELNKKGITASSDGRVGEADIVVTSPTSLEIECKLTSMREKGGVSLQSDAETLEKKVSLDYLYLVTNREFSKFCVLYFKGLTRSDFSDDSPGSRGKVKLIKHRAMSKCFPVLGKITNNKTSHLSKLYNNLAETINAKTERLDELNERVNSSIEGTSYYKRSIQVLENETERMNRKIDKISESIFNKESAFATYSFDLEAV